jgi:hypothetical protein
MVTSVRFVFGTLLAAAAFATPALAQSVEDLAGTWTRSGGEETPTVGVYTLEASDGKLVGSLTNPPEGFSCEVELGLEGDGLVGTATWREAEVDMQIETRWELTVSDNDTLSGRCQWKVWAHDGTVENEGWDEYELERVKRKGLVVDGEGAEAPYGDSITSPRALYGGYEALGSGWTIRNDMGTWKIEPAEGPHQDVVVEITERAGSLVGQARLPDGTISKLELGWNEETQSVSGRSSWTDGSGEEGWAPIEFKRLPRLNTRLTEVQPATPRAGNPGSIAGVYKRADGLYVRLQGDETAVEGDLVDADGTVVARVQLREGNGVWRGTASFDGVETKWQYSATDEGLEGRQEFADHLDGVVVVRGWGHWPMTPLKKLN